MRLDNDFWVEGPESGGYQRDAGDVPSSRSARPATVFRCRLRRDDCVRRDVACKPKVFQERGSHHIHRKMMRKLQSWLEISRHVLDEQPQLK